MPPIIIKDGVCTYELNNTVGERLAALGGLANMSTGTADHLEQNWFWYRSDTDTREYALSNRVFASSSNNRARLVYLEPITDGQIPDALLFDLEYTLTDLSTVGVAATLHLCVNLANQRDEPAIIRACRAAYGARRL